MKKFSIFLVFVASVGFSLGTLVLVGPVRWLTDFSRAEGGSDALEAVLVRLVVVALVVVSLFLSGCLTRFVSRKTSRVLGIGLPAITLFMAGMCAWWWFASAQGGGTGEESFAGTRFTFGSYPSPARLAGLADEGYTGIVSLLHPAVFPFETRLIEEGRSAAAGAGLEYFHVPMLPWVSDNTEALRRIEGLVARDDGRFYVHCLLGKDRVRMVKAWVEKLDPRVEALSTPNLARHEESRRIYDGMQWERGEVVLAGGQTFVSPHPVDNEYVSFVFPGSAGRVFSILNPDNPDDRHWIDEESRILSGNGMELSVLPIPLHPYEPRRALEVADRVRRIPGPKLVHAFLSVGSKRSPAAEAFVQAFRSRLAPVPPSLFREPLAGGPATVVAPNVALGPPPRGSEFGGVLYRRGIRGFIYVGAAGDERARSDGELCRREGIDWRAIDAASDLLELLTSGGPWYLYGPGLAALRPRIVDTLGPAIPPLVSGMGFGSS